MAAVAAVDRDVMVVAAPEDAGSAPLVPQDDQRDGSAPGAPQYAAIVDLDSAAYERTVPVPTRRGLASSPALFLWESRTTNVDVMSVSNTTRPAVVSRYGYRRVYVWLICAMLHNAV